MLRGVWKLLSFDGAIGRWEYFKVTWGLGFIPLILTLLAISVKPEEKYIFLAAAVAAGIAIGFYMWICIACMFKRLYHIFSNRYFIIFLFFLVYFGVQFVLYPVGRAYISMETMIIIKKLTTWLLCMFLVFMPGRGESDKLLSGKAFFLPFVLFVSLLFATKYYHISSYVTGKSMTPSLNPYDRLYVNIFDKEFKRGDIIVFDSVYKQRYIKRIIGLPGDKIEVDGDDVYINDEKLNEDYLNTETQPFKCSEDLTCGPLVVPENSYYVLGDNRGNSHDSRFYGVVNKDEIFGKASHIFYPIKRRHSL